MGFPRCLDGEESACNAAEPGSIPGLGRSTGEGNGNPLQYSCLGNPYGQKCLVDYSPCGREDTKLSDTHTILVAQVGTESSHSSWPAKDPHASTH